MIVIVSRNCIRPDQRQAFLEITAPLVEQSRAEEGCLSYDLVADPADPNVFAFVERWRDQQALDAHNRSGHFQTIVPQMKALRQPAGSQTTIYRSL